MRKIKSAKHGVLAFIIVLLLIPIGHAMMVLTEHLFHGSKFIAAGALGFIGVGLLIAGVRYNHKPILATLMGFIGGILVWTGWVEFSFVWIAEKLKVQPLIIDNEIATKPEYLVMMSSLGLLASMSLFFLFTNTRCLLFRWIQNKLGFRKFVAGKVQKPLSVISFSETIMIIWLFYVVLLLVYDEDLAGSQHPATYIVAFGSLFWALYLSTRLIRIKKFDFAIRYAIPTVIIFWNFVEVMGRWNLLKEIWIDPFGHWVENILILALFIIFLLQLVRKSWKQRKSEERILKGA